MASRRCTLDNELPRQISLEDTTRAASIGIGVCADCSAPHIVLFDSERRVIAVAIIKPEYIPSFVEELQRTAEVLKKRDSAERN
jgi:hypothetical protein